MNQLIIVLAFGVSFVAQAQMDLRGLPPARTAQESVSTLDQRRNALVDYFVNQPLGEPPQWKKVSFHAFSNTTLARLYRKTDLAAVSENILKPEFQPWQTGTDFALIGSLCRRRGDYDFTLNTLVRMAYMDFQAHQTLLTPAARDKMYHVLLSEKGNVHHDQISVGGCMTVTDTENHILQIEVSRYLTNQLLLAEAKKLGQPTEAYDNSKNGFNEWMLNHLAEFLKNDFSEFNSRPYEGYAWMSINNLYDYAENPQVKLMAQMTLDYLSAKFAIGSNGMRRMQPYRRLKELLNSNRLVAGDLATQRNFYLGGNYNYLAFESNNGLPGLYPEEEIQSMMPAMGHYQIPNLILDTQIDKQTEYFQKIRHSDVEIYHSSPSFLLTSGGRYRNMPDFGTGGNDAWAVATTIIPTRGEAELKNLFYILGDKDVNRRNNTCFAKNFACGFNIHVPENLDKSCVVKKDQWQFYDMQKCKNYGFYVAINQVKPDQDWDDVNDNYATMEVVEADGRFDQFMQSRIEQNPQKNIKAESGSIYKTYMGHTLEFVIYNANLGAYPVTAIDGVKQIADFNLWPRAEGDIMTSVEPGLIEIRNLKLRKKLILDGRNALAPKRIESAL